MSTFFDWEFEEGSRPPRRPDEGTAAPKRSRRWLRWGAVLVILLLIVGLVARVFLIKRQSIIGEAEAQLRTAVELELKAIADCDVGLFRSLQDPDPSWQDRQVARYISPNADLLWQETIRATQPGLECRRGGDALHSKPSLVFPKLAPCRQSLKRTVPLKKLPQPTEKWTQTWTLPS